MMSDERLARQSKVQFSEMKRKDPVSKNSDYQKMIDKYPKDPTYNYYYGRCLLYAKNNYSEAEKYLKFAYLSNL